MKRAQNQRFFLAFFCSISFPLLLVVTFLPFTVSVAGYCIPACEGRTYRGLIGGWYPPTKKNSQPSFSFFPFTQLMEAHGVQAPPVGGNVSVKKDEEQERKQRNKKKKDAKKKNKAASKNNSTNGHTAHSNAQVNTFFMATQFSQMRILCAHRSSFSFIFHFNFLIFILFNIILFVERILRRMI